MKPEFDFDEEIDRREVPALKTHPVVLGGDGAGLFAAGVADMDFKVAPAIIAAIKNRVGHGIFGYETLPDDLIPAMVEWMEVRHRWKIEPAHILRAPNVLNSLAIAASLFSDVDDGIIVQPPVFFDFYDIINENGRKLVANLLKLNNGSYEIDFENLEQLASNPRNKIMFVCNPHNPVGRVWQRDELIRLGDICARNNVLVVSDELHGDIVYKGNKYTPFASLGTDYALNSISLVSPAKSFNIAGCCWSLTIVPDPDRRKQFQTENSRLTVNKNNAFSSVAMLAAYRDGGPWLDAVIDYLQKNLNLVRNHLSNIPRVELIEPEGTFLLWLDFRGLPIPPNDLHSFLRLHAGWATTRGLAFGEQGAGFARLNIACPRARLEKALTQLAQATSTI